MRRYGYADYGGRGNTFPKKQQPVDADWKSARDISPKLIPSDLIPRRPSGLAAVDMPIEQVRGATEFDAHSFIESLVSKFRERGIGLVWDGMRYARFRNIPLLIGLNDVVVLPTATDTRTYLFIVNTHPVNDMFVAFDSSATVNLGVPLRAGDGFFEWLFVVPQNDVHLVADAVNTTGVLIFAELDPVAALRNTNLGR